MCNGRWAGSSASRETADDCPTGTRYGWLLVAVFHASVGGTDVSCVVRTRGERQVFIELQGVQRSRAQSEKRTRLSHKISERPFDVRLTELQQL